MLINSVSILNSKKHCSLLLALLLAGTFLCAQNIQEELEPPVEGKQWKQTKKKEDSKAKKRHFKRGSQKEKEIFDKAVEPLIDRPQKHKKHKVPANAVVHGSLKPNERPSLKYLDPDGKKKKSVHAMPVMQPENKLENDLTVSPKDFEIKYNLKEDAQVSITVMREDGVPMHHFEIPPGHEGAKKGNNRIIAWDGRDNLDVEVNPGKYFVMQAIQYTKSGKDETRIIHLNKEKGGQP
ncbi:hypothetical protein ACFL6Y_03835 [Elusimicrobiota bacterium]